MIEALQAEAREQGTEYELHGVTVVDPFRALEEDSPLTKRWIDAQSERSRSLLHSWSRDDGAARIEQLLSVGVLGAPRLAGGRVFYTKREGEREQPLLMVVGLANGEDREPRAILDPTDYGDRAALDWFVPSPEGRLVAFGISNDGDERSTLRVLDVERGEVREADVIPRTKWCNLAWLHSEAGFYYTRYPKPDEVGFDVENEDTYFPRVFYHELGADPSTDLVVFSSGEGTDFPSVAVSEDDRWVVVNVFRGWSASDVYLLDRGAPPADREDAPGASDLQPIVTGIDALTHGTVHDGTLYLVTNQDSPRYRVDRVPARRPTSAREVVISEGEGTIESFRIAGDFAVVHRVEDVQSRLSIHDRAGVLLRDVVLPTIGEVGGLSLSDDGKLLAFEFSAYTMPPTLFASSTEGGEAPRVLDRIYADIEFDALVVSRERVVSRDGTEVPVTLVHRRDMERDGEQPVLLYGYGGFNVSLLPSFARSAIYWVERGGVYAVANLRGGGEFGEAWHRGGNLENKVKVFEDFEAVIRWFSSSGISRPGRIGITGGSNGGLLMGAMLTRCPDAFGAAASYVGLYDMIRYHEFPPAELWISEYGSSEDEEQFGWLREYSPYHRVEDGTAYPSALIETADHDSRVFWGHSTKFAARLQEATSGDDPILFYMVRSVGHGAGTRLSDTVARYTRMYSFFEHELAP